LASWQAVEWLVRLMLVMLRVIKIVLPCCRVTRYLFRRDGGGQGLPERRLKLNEKYFQLCLAVKFRFDRFRVRFAGLDFRDKEAFIKEKSGITVNNKTRMNLEKKG